MQYSTSAQADMPFLVDLVRTEIVAAHHPAANDFRQRVAGVEPAGPGIGLVVDAGLIELGRVCKASRWRELWRIRLPYAVPFVFSGLKAAITLSVLRSTTCTSTRALAVIKLPRRPANSLKPSPRMM